MASKSKEKTRLTRYLVGEISEAERERLEEEYFADDEAFEQVLSTEDDLIDAYVRGELSAEERRRFEEIFLASARGRERVQFARSLAGAVADARPMVATTEQAPRPPRPTFLDTLLARGVTLRFALGAAALVMAVGLTWLLFERARMREELRQLRAESTALTEKAQEMERRAAAEQARHAEMLAQLEAARTQSTPEAGRQEAEASAPRRPPRAARLPGGRLKENDTVIARNVPGSRGSDSAVSFDLTPGLVRGGGTNKFEVPGGATFVRLRLSLETESSHQIYRALIQTADGRSVWRADSFKPERTGEAGAAIDLPPVPARDLPPGDYILRLSGQQPDDSFEGVADYSFRVVRK